MLASEYGWEKKTILEQVYLDEVLQLQDIIKKRRLENYRMQMVIYHTDKPNELLTQLEEELKEYELPSEKLDTAGMDKLKGMMAISRQFDIK